MSAHSEHPVLNQRWSVGTRGEVSTVYVPQIPPMRAVVVLAEVADDDIAHHIAGLHNEAPEQAKESQQLRELCHEAADSLAEAYSCMSGGVLSAEALAAFTLIDRLRAAGNGRL